MEDRELDHYRRVREMVIGDAFETAGIRDGLGMYKEA